MRLPDIFRNISTILSKSSSGIRYSNVTEDMVNDQLDDVKWGLTMLIELFGKLSDKDQVELYLRVKQELKINSNLNTILGKSCTDFIQNIDSKLVGKARSLGFMRSLLLTSQRLTETVDDLRKHTKEIFNNKEGIVIGEAQVTHGILLGCISTCMVFTDFCMFIIAIFSHVISKQNNPNIPKYMIEKVMKHGEMCIELINTLSNTMNGSKIINTIMDIKNRGIDFRLTSGEVIRSNFNNSIAANGGIFLSLVGVAVTFFSTIGEHIVSWRHEHYEMMKERKIWLENHVANIKLSLENMDKNDPQYIKTLQIIQYHEDKLAEYEKKLNKYYGE